MSGKAIHETAQQVLEEIERALNGIQFGSVEITLHEGRVTQIERREKVRLAADNKPVRPGLYGRPAAKQS